MDFAAIANGSLVCSAFVGVRSRGVFYGDNPFTFAAPGLMSQISISSLLISVLQFLLTPLGQSTFVPQSIGGILLGTSFAGKSGWLKRTFFSKKSSYINETVSLFGCMFFLFLVGVKTDISMVKKSGKKAVAIGLGAFFLPLGLNHALAWALKSYLPMDPLLHRSLLIVASLHCISSYHVVACLLADLKLLNSELGRLAVSSSMVSGLCSWVWAVLVFTSNQTVKNHSAHLWKTLCVIGMLILIIYVLRPIMFWIVRRSSRVKTIKEGHIVAVFLMVLMCSLLGELVGQHFLFGPMLLGLIVPDGPPLGSALVDKMDSYVSCILLPIYFVVSSTKINMSAIQVKNFGILVLIAFISILGKLVGTILPAIYSKMPILNALCLGLILSTQGIIEVQIIRGAFELYLIDEESYSIMFISIVLSAAITSPILKLLYKPSRRYRTLEKRTIQHARTENEFRILACIYHQDNTPSIINLLELSNPTKTSPICFYVVHLIELSGRSSSILVDHNPRKRKSSHSIQSNHIVNAFRTYEEQRQGSVTLNPFTAISPYTTMHDDVCEIALEKRASLVIIPFHNQWSVHQGDESLAAAIRSVNHNILHEAPCSVGILVDRGDSVPLATSGISYSVGMIFLGGPDDREALAYAARLAGQPSVMITVVQFMEFERKSKNLDNQDQHLDVEMIKEFVRSNVGRSKRHKYKKEVVKDSLAMICAIQSLENCFDLILVGRCHARESPLLAGINEWSEFPELGAIGDMLASSESNCKASVLVVQHQAFVGGDIVESRKYLMKGPFALIDIPRASGAQVMPVA